MERLQLVRRGKPRETVYLRSPPITALNPTPAQAECRLEFGCVSRAGVRAPLDVVASMVGGEPVIVNGKEAVRMPDGRVLMKHQAYISALMTGWRSPRSTYGEPPLWVKRLAALARGRANLIRALAEVKA